MNEKSDDSFLPSIQSGKWMEDEWSLTFVGICPFLIHDQSIESNRW